MPDIMSVMDKWGHSITSSTNLNPLDVVALLSDIAKTRPNLLISFKKGETV